MVNPISLQKHQVKIVPKLNNWIMCYVKMYYCQENRLSTCVYHVFSMCNLKPNMTKILVKHNENVKHLTAWEDEDDGNDTADDNGAWVDFFRSTGFLWPATTYCQCHTTKYVSEWVRFYLCHTWQVWSLTHSSYTYCPIQNIQGLFFPEFKAYWSRLIYDLSICRVP